MNESKLPNEPNGLLRFVKPFKDLTDEDCRKLIEEIQFPDLLADEPVVVMVKQ